MKAISNISQLSLPDVYKETLIHMVSRLHAFPAVKNIILFGSCARKEVSMGSDIDLALVVSEPLTLEEEWNIDNSIRNWDTMLPCDVIFLPEAVLSGDVHGETVIRPILQEGVVLNELLC